MVVTFPVSPPSYGWHRKNSIDICWRSEVAVLLIALDDLSKEMVD